MALRVDIRKDLGAFRLSVQFETEEGVLGILGASGSGKSMTLRCIAGVMTPDEGQIELNGTMLFDSRRRINKKPQERGVGLLFQNYALFPNMTIRQNLLAPLRARHTPGRQAQRETEEMMQRFFLEGLGDRKPHQLSGGQQQRAALARILLSRPSLLMLDEPFSALDEYLRWQLELELKEVLRAYDGPTLLVSHSRGEIFRMCDRICVMDGGTCAPADQVHALFENPRTRAAALLSGCKNYSAAGALQCDRYEAKDWRVCLQSDAPAPPDLKWIGVRSHYVRPIQKGQEDLPNVFSCRVLQVVEDVFSMAVMLSPEGSDASIRMDCSKQEWQALCQQGRTPEVLSVHVDPHDVMLLA